MLELHLKQPWFINSDSKDLTKRTISDKILRDQEKKQDQE